MPGSSDDRRASSALLVRSLVLPTVVCGALLSVTTGAQLLGADLPDGTVHAQTGGR